MAPVDQSSGTQNRMWSNVMIYLNGMKLLALSLAQPRPLSTFISDTGQFSQNSELINTFYPAFHFIDHKEADPLYFSVLNDSNFLGKFLLFQDLTSLVGPRPPHCGGFKNTLRHTTFGRKPLDVSSASRRDLYLTTHNTHMRQTPMPRRDLSPQSQHARGRKLKI
jgi:hypothetical protein